MHMKSYIFVAVQFACLAAIALTGPLFARNPLLLAAEVAGFALIAWAGWTMRTSKLNILPDVRANATLVRSGPYAFIRHPMYSALLLIALALVLDDFSPIRLALWVVLLVDLILKLTYEESLLVGRFPEYAAYRQDSRRLIPFVF
jgi:protein-S-isoprenylcysteine O-methyltransferase Ste14